MTIRKESTAKIVHFAVATLIATVMADVVGAQSTAACYSVTPQTIQSIPSGTVVRADARIGWSHLVIKSVPRCSFGDLDDVPERDKRLASTFCNVMLANVRQQPGTVGDFYLTNIAVAATL